MDTCLSSCAEKLRSTFLARLLPAIRLGDVTETNRTQAPKEQTAENWRSRTEAVHELGTRGTLALVGTCCV